MSAALPDASRRVLEAAARLGLDITVTEHARPTRTAEEAAAACGCALGQIAKSLVFAGRDTGRPVLLLVAGHHRVNEERVAAAIGEPLRRPDGRTVRSWTGFAIGGIPPFGHASPLRTFMDLDLLTHDVVWAAAGTPATVFPIAPARLAEAVRAETPKLA